MFDLEQTKWLRDVWLYIMHLSLSIFSSQFPSEQANFHLVHTSARDRLCAQWSGDRSRDLWAFLHRSVLPRRSHQPLLMLHFLSPIHTRLPLTQRPRPSALHRSIRPPPPPPYHHRSESGTSELQREKPLLSWTVDPLVLTGASGLSAPSVGM